MMAGAACARGLMNPWISLAGVAGYAIIREGTIVKTLTTQMN